MRKNSATDSSLVYDYINGDEKALEILIKRHQQRLFGFIYSKVKDSDISEDIFQDTFVRVIRTLKRGNYTEKGKFLPWVMRISNNLIIDYFRKSYRMPIFKNTDEFDVFSVLGDDVLNAENSIIKKQIYEDIKGLISQLPEEQKQVLIMRMYDDMSFNEISENTKVSINTALGRMRYALINLRKLIEQNKITLVS